MGSSEFPLESAVFWGFPPRKFLKSPLIALTILTKSWYYQVHLPAGQVFKVGAMYFQGESYQRD